jgi:hypothetical protein
VKVMPEKIVNLHKDKVAWQTLLHQTLERDDVEAVVMVVRIDGRWTTAWCNETMAGLAMAAMKLFRDISDWLEADER